MTLIGNRCRDIIACTGEIISHSISKRQWCARSLLRGPSKTQRSKIDLFRKSRVQTNDSWRIKKRDWTPSVLSLRAKCTKMMENMGYDLASGPSLNFGKGRRTLLWSFIPKGKAPDYYQQTRMGLGYVSTPIPSAFEFEESLYHDHSSGTSCESRCQCWRHLQGALGEHGLNKPPRR